MRFSLLISRLTKSFCVHVTVHVSEVETSVLLLEEGQDIGKTRVCSLVLVDAICFLVGGKEC